MVTTVRLEHVAHETIPFSLALRIAHIEALGEYGVLFTQ